MSVLLIGSPGDKTIKVNLGFYASSVPYKNTLGVLRELRSFSKQLPSQQNWQFGTSLSLSDKTNFFQFGVNYCYFFENFSNFSSLNK